MSVLLRAVRSGDALSSVAALSVCGVASTGPDAVLEREPGDSGVLDTFAKLCVELMDVPSDMSRALKELSRSSW